MNIDKKKYISIVFIMLFVILPFFYIGSLLSSRFQGILHQYEGTEMRLKTSQASEDFTVASSLHKLVWIEGRLTLTLTSNESGLITCDFKDSYNGKYFTQVNQIIDLTGENESQKIQFNFKPHFTTLPGNYNLTLTITGFYNYSENFEIVLGMGYIVLFLVLIIFSISIIIVLVKKKGTKDVKSISSTPEEYEPSSISETSSGHIQCPECKKLIDEGLTFCPECGARIPEFLRFNPNSPRGL